MHQRLPEVITTPRGTRVELTCARLRRAAIDSEMLVSGDDRISEHDAARLLGMHSDTLARKRLDGSGPTAYGRPLGRAKISYRLLDLATWLEGGRNVFEKIEHEPDPTRSNRT
jgi:hypothetical protein